jgi:CheY-like chemotaxis protein
MKRVIIVDDALDLGRVLQTLMLTVSTELSISVVPSAEEAVLEAGRHPIELLVSDIRLPGISGLELVKKIRQKQPNVKVIFITGLSDGPVVQQAQKMGAEGFFFKPLDFSDFLACVRKCLDLAPAQLIEGPTTPLAAAGATPNVTAAPALAAPETAAQAALPSLSEVITGLRQSLGALAVFVLDDNGHVVAQAGDLSAIDLEAEWAPALFSAMSAGEKVSRLVKGQELGQVQGFAGADYDLVMSGAGPVALLAVLKKGRASLRLALAFEEFLAVHTQLQEILRNMGVALKPAALAIPPVTAAESPAEKSTPTEPEPGLDELEEVIQKSGAALNPEEVEAYWESAPEEGKIAPESPDVISYDQASRLGLAPKE